MDSKIKLAITTGDPDGIGPEVAVKALCHSKQSKNVQYVLFRSRDLSKSLHGQLKRKFKVKTVNSLAEGLWTDHGAQVIDVISDDSPARWVELAAKLCMERQLNGLVTAPLSKTSIIAAGFKDIGHTEILARVSGRKNLFMGFTGSKFSVVLATGHIPLSQVSTQFNSAVLGSALMAADDLRRILPKTAQRRPLAVVGINPHAGEASLLGNQEVWMSNVLKSWKGHSAFGPLVPDAAFLPINWKNFSVYVCPYHDQGLIPFKLAHGFHEGVHITLGLPFIRTSVDHGTAKDLAGKNKAQFGSMAHAIQTAYLLAKEKLQ